MKKREWSQEEIEILTRRYPTDAMSDIADDMGINVTSVRLMVQKLGLKKADTFNKYSYYGRYTNKRRK